MNVPNPLLIGHCTNGPVLLTGSSKMEHKFVINMVEYNGNKHRNTVACKTTSKGHDKLFFGDFMINDFFGRGRSKVQPYNIVRMPSSDLLRHRYIGELDRSYLPKFEIGLRIAIQRQLLNPQEILRVIDAWSPIFALEGDNV